MTVPQPTRIRIEHMPCVFPHAAGLDIGSAEIVAALPPDGDSTVRPPEGRGSFATPGAVIFGDAAIREARPDLVDALEVNARHSGQTMHRPRTAALIRLAVCG